MALNQYFTNDIFVSYTRSDDSQGFVSSLVNILEEILNSKRNLNECKLSIWKDNRLQNHYFNEEIKSQIRQSAVFLIFKSSNYSQSDYCRREQSSFNRVLLYQNTILNLGNISRKIILQTSEMGIGQNDTLESEISQYKLYIDNTTNYPDSVEDDFQGSLEELADVILYTLRLINEKSVDFSKVRPFKVFIASTPKHLDEYKQELLVALEGLRNIDREICLDVDIEYKIPPPDSYEEHKLRLNDCQKYNYDILVHLFSTHPAQALKADELKSEVFADHLQYSFFEPLSTPKLRIVWMDETAYRKTDPTDKDSHWRFLYRLKYSLEKTGISAQMGPTKFISSNISDVAWEIGSAIKELVKEELYATPNSSVVCLDVHSEAAIEAININQKIEASKKVEVKLYNFNSNESSLENFDTFQKQLSQSSSYMLYLHDEHHIIWARKRAEEAFKLIKKEGIDKKMILYTIRKIAPNLLKDFTDIFDMVVITSWNNLKDELGI